MPVCDLAVIEATHTHAGCRLRSCALALHSLYAFPLLHPLSALNVLHDSIPAHPPLCCVLEMVSAYQVDIVLGLVIALVRAQNLKLSTMQEMLSLLPRV